MVVVVVVIFNRSYEEDIRGKDREGVEVKRGGGGRQLREKYSHGDQQNEQHTTCVFLSVSVRMCV